MKTSIKSTLLVAFAFLAFTSTVFAAGKDPIKVKKSSITWVGKKVTGEHTGTISFKSGDVTVKNGALVGGTFVVDMNTINVTDLEGKGKEKLEGHLKSDDFFGTEKFPTATFTITSVKGNEVKGDLTIKGHTETQSFTLTTKGNTISGDVVIDRTKFGIRYGSNSFFDNLKDKAIHDEFELTVNVVF